MYLNHIMTNRSIVIVLSNRHPLVVQSTMSGVYANVRQLLHDKRYADAVQAASIAEKLKSTVGRLTIVDGGARIDDEVLPSALSMRLVQFFNEGLDFNPLLNFWDRLKLNPSKQSQQALYGFLEYNHLPITEDGCFIGYKYVRDNFFDCWSGTFDNHPGKQVSMPREGVDPNPENTCSTGLHVCAYEYAISNGGAGHIVEVKVDPYNVVTVPPDCKQQKMRTCGYTIVCEHKGGQLTSQVYTSDNSSNSFEVFPALTVPPVQTKKTATKPVKKTGKVPMSKIVAADVKALIKQADGRIRVPMSWITLLSGADTDYVYTQVSGKTLNISGKVKDGWLRVKLEPSGAARIPAFHTQALPGVVRIKVAKGNLTLY